MRIDRIDLLRFGHFVGREIELPAREPDFYLLYGDNEAGKSTLLRSISALLFGVPPRTQDAFGFKPSELRIGAIVSDREKSLSFRRRKGTSATLLNGDETPLQENALASFLRELDRERFEQFFALTHDRLREGGDELLRGNGDVGSALFQAAGLLELRKLLEDLDKEARELFSAKSRGKVIGAAMEEYKQAKSEARRLAISATTVKDKQAALQAATENLEKLKSQSQALQHELVRLRRIAGNKPDIARLQDLRTGLAALQHVPTLPATARRQRDEAASTLTGATTQIETLTGQIARRKARIEELPLSAKLKSHAKQIEELNAEISDYVRSVKDRPKRSSERDEAIGLAEVEWKEIWRKRSIADAEDLRGAYSRKTEIIELITEQARLSTALEQAEEHLHTGREEQQRLTAQLAAHPKPQDPSTLFATIDQAKALGDVEQAVARMKTEIERLHGAATGDHQTLTLFDSTADALASMPVPLMSTIDLFAREWEALAASQKEMQAQAAKVDESIRETQGEVDSLGKEVRSAGENELAEARAKRDRLWQLIRESAIEHKLSLDKAHKQSGFSESLPDALTSQVAHADRIADLRFFRAKDVAIRDRLVKQIETGQAEQQRLEAEMSSLKRQEKELRQRWKKEWRGLGADPLSPAEMKEWLQQRQTILNRLEQSRQKEDELRLFQERARQMAVELNTQLEKLGFKTESESLPVLIRIAEQFARGVEEQSRSRADLERSLASLAPEHRQTKVNECKAKLTEWSQRWIPLVRALLLPEIATTDEVTEALVVLEKVFSHLHDADSLKHRIKRIGDNIDAFEKKASELIAGVDPSLASLPPDQAAASLHTRHVEIEKAETERRTLEAQNTSDESSIAESRSKLQAAESVLAKLRHIANCSTDQELEFAIAGAEERATKRGEYDRIADGLIERNAKADVKQIEEEAAGYDFDSLQIQIESKESERKSLEDAIFQTGSQHGKLREEFERLEASSESAAQTQKAEDALARVRPAVSQYLRLRLAAEAVQRAIESYREKHEAPVLKRASELFANLTLHDYSGLTTTFGSADKPVLVAVRKAGEKIELDGLSDGTRDQLYLALRLAFIEHHVETVAPCPVIFDDILINFDDRRSLATLQVLKGLAEHTQVLFFTHHRRLAELGVQAGAEVVEFSNVATAAIA